jgi:predicted porin
MKFKTTAIALAVAGSVAAPVAVQAGADEIYASARVGLWNVDQDNAQTTEVKSFSSRFGAKGETDLGNGMTGFGRYEWDVDENDFSIRHRYVGLKGDFGSVLAGQTFHTFYNYVVGPLDNPWWHSGYAMINYRSRTDKGLTYTGGTGKFNFGITGYFNQDAEEKDPDQMELGASFGVGDSTIGFAYQTTQDGTTQGNGSDEDIMALAWSGIGIASTTLGVSYMNQDNDNGLVIDWLIGNAYVHLETEQLDAVQNGNATDRDRMSITLGYTQSLGRKTTAYYEINSIDNDTGDSNADRTAIMAVLKYDII